ncbi:hypothetical protein H311_04789, partial [Anncaliia algerae PRA109]
MRKNTSVKKIRSHTKPTNKDIYDKPTVVFDVRNHINQSKEVIWKIFINVPKNLWFPLCELTILYLYKLYLNTNNLDIYFVTMLVMNIPSLICHLLIDLHENIIVINFVNTLYSDILRMYLLLIGLDYRKNELKGYVLYGSERNFIMKVFQIFISAGLIATNLMNLTDAKISIFISIYTFLNLVSMIILYFVLDFSSLFYNYIFISLILIISIINCC